MVGPASPTPAPEGLPRSVVGPASPTPVPEGLLRSVPTPTLRTC